MESSLNDNEVSLLIDDSKGYIVRDFPFDNQFCNEIHSDAMNIRNNDDNNNNDKILKPARMGSNTNAIWDNNYFRGDVSCWLTPKLCKELNLNAVNKFVQSMIKQLKPLKQHLHLCDDFSVQFAVFKGNGERYVRHLDVNNSDNNNSNKPQRKITAILYLNHEWDGGQLRIFHNANTNDEYIDIDPSFGKLVIFRSDLIEHEVLPSFKDRMAITFWASALKPPHANANPNANTKQESTYTLGRSPLPISPLGCNYDNKFDEKTIFVSIAAYRDSECQYTIKNLFEMAKVKMRIFIGVVWQGDRYGEDSNCFVHYPPFNHNDTNSNTNTQYPYSKNVRTLELHWSQARGPCWARHLAQSLVTNEDYVMQIDSHMRFRPNWDCYLINLLEQLKVNNVSSSSFKPVITTYPLGYTLPDDYPDDIRATLLIPTKFDESGILRQSGRAINLTPPQIYSKLQDGHGGGWGAAMECPLWAAGFNFSERSSFLDVPYDPTLDFLFFGEEISMAARLFTHGYDFFAPIEAVVYHLWNRGHRPPFAEVKHESREILKEEATGKVLRLLKGDVGATGRYGLGNIRTIAEFEERLGVSFKSLHLNLETATGGGNSNDNGHDNDNGNNNGNGNSRKNWKAILSDLNGYSENVHGTNVEDNNTGGAPMKSLEVLKLLKNYL